MSKRKYRVDDISRLTGLKPSSVRKKVGRDKTWRKKVGATQPGGPKGDWFFDADKVDAWLEELKGE